MKRQLVVRPLAEKDLADSYRWYEKQKNGLGAEFLDQVEAALDRITETPLGFPIVHKDTRRYLTQQFPFAIFYVVEPGRIVVLAVLHQARDPQRWRRRK